MKSDLLTFYGRARRFLAVIKYIFGGSFPGIDAPISHTEEEMRALFHAYSLRGRVDELKVPLANRILVVAPHPDDETIGCGGLLLLHPNTVECRLLCVFNGELGGRIDEVNGESQEDYRRRLVGVRSNELRANARLLGFRSTVELGIPESGPGPTADDVHRVREILLEFRPEIVILPWAFDEHPHHRLTGRLVAEASRGLTFMTLGYEVWGLLPENCFLDITEVIERKLRLVDAYKSQTATVDYRGYCEALAKVRAFHKPVRQMRRGAVEVFHRLPAWQYCAVVSGQTARLGRVPRASAKVVEIGDGWVPSASEPDRDGRG